MSQRSFQPEWIDLGPAYYTSGEYRACLYHLDRIGRFLGGDRATLWGIKTLQHSPSSILDIGCGGGLFTMRLASHYPQTKITGIDISQEAIAFAQEHLRCAQPRLPHVQFLVSSEKQLDNLSGQFDIVTSTLVCHHLSDQALISFLKQACHLAKKAVVINDLHRHFLATLAFSILSPIFFRNRLIWHDGRLSIKRSFTRQDWEAYLKAAGIAPAYYTITWHWAFRWIIILKTAAMRKDGIL